MYHTITNNKFKMETNTETGRDCVCFCRSRKSPLHHHPGCFFKSIKSPLGNNLGCFYWSIRIPLTRYLGTLLGTVYNSQSWKFRGNGPVLQPGQTCGRWWLWNYKERKESVEFVRPMNFLFMYCWYNIY